MPSHLQATEFRENSVQNQEWWNLIETCSYATDYNKKKRTTIAENEDLIRMHGFVCVLYSGQDLTMGIHRSVFI